MRYVYNGPISGVTLNQKDGNGNDVSREIALHPGKEVELPPENEYTKTLVALGYLSRSNAKSEPATSQESKEGKK